MHIIKTRLPVFQEEAGIQVIIIPEGHFQIGPHFQHIDHKCIADFRHTHPVKEIHMLNLHAEIRKHAQKTLNSVRNLLQRKLFHRELRHPGSAEKEDRGEIKRISRFIPVAQHFNCSSHYSASPLEISDIATILLHYAVKYKR